jgi:hypothetical protein
MKELLNWVVHCDEIIRILKEHEPLQRYTEHNELFENLNSVSRRRVEEQKRQKVT